MALPLVIEPRVLWMHRLEPTAGDLAWLASARWSAVIRTIDELTVVCDLADVPGATVTSGPLRAVKVDAVLDHDVTGVLAGIAGPLAEAGISIFALSTFDTDYTLVPDERVAEAVDALMLAGFSVTEA